VETDAREHVLACNTRGEWHLVLFFDLAPGVQVHVRLRRPPA
jgi:hypothetical protein